MNLFSSFPFVRMIFPFLAGIITAIYLHSNSGVWLAMVVLCVALSTTETFFLKLSSKYRWRYVNGTLFVFSFFFLGACLVQYNTQEFYSNHFSKAQTAGVYYAEITEAPVEKKSAWKVIVQVKKAKTKIGWVNTRGKLLCYIRKGSYFPKTGDGFVFNGNIQRVESAKNPGQFDYRQYLYYHNIYHQVYLGSHQLKYTGRKGNALQNLAFDMRKELIRSFKNCGLKGNELAVASALLFGVTDQLDPVLIRAYSGTGALHVLSVSGLHVAILYGFLQIVLSFLYHRKNGRITLGVIILLVIWFYALLTGLTPSVLRSSTMFTFIVFGQMLKRQSSVYNSLAASAFVLLCIDPFLIMEVGFQLSYLAVTGIIALYPILNRQLKVNNRFFKPVWDITCVSIAAQIATLPLGLLYFHQFPNYFVFSNLLVIPLSGIILYTGIVASLFYFFPVVQFLFVYILEWLIHMLNTTVEFIGQLPYALLEGISITILETCLLYGIIVCWLTWYKTSQPRYLKFALGCGVIICLLQVNEAMTLGNQKKIIVYSTPGNTAIDVIYGTGHLFISDKAFVNDVDKMLFSVTHNWDNLNLGKGDLVYTDSLVNVTNGFAMVKHNVLFFGDKTFQFVNESFNPGKSTLFVTDYILLTRNSAVNLEDLDNSLQKTVFIADGSNGRFKIKAWKKQATRKHMRFYTTQDNGAFVLELN